MTVVHNCSHCEKSFTIKSRWRNHLRIHTGDKPFICKVCGRAFLDNYACLSHSKTHDVDRRVHKCDICGKDFLKNSNLKSHIFTHSKQKKGRVQYSDNIKLEAVSKAKEIGTEKASLLLNIPSVSIRSWLAICKAPKVCQFCGKSFAAPSLLDRHVKTIHGKNTGSKCNRKTTESFKEEVRNFFSVSSTETVSSLFKVSEATVRRWNKLKVNPIKCEVCDKLFAYENELSKHNMNKHGGITYSPKTEFHKESFSSSIGAELFNSTKGKETEDIIMHDIGDEVSRNIMDGKKNELKDQVFCKTTYENATELINEVIMEDGRDKEEASNEIPKFSHDSTLESIKEVKIESNIPEFEFENLKGLGIFLTMSCICAVALSTLFKKMHLERKHERIDSDKDSEVIDTEELKNEKVNLETKKIKSDCSEFICSYCGKNFKILFYLSRHIVKHTGEKNYQCDKCPQKFAYKNDVPRHIRITHTQDREKDFYKCSFPSCGKTLSTRNSRVLHEELHGEGFICDDCGQSFKTQGRMKRHAVKNHTKNYELNCDICGKGYVKKELNRFIQHTVSCTAKREAKPTLINCPVCSKVFIRKQRFERHMQMHAKTKPFQCDQCQKIYADKYNLQRHIEKLHQKK